MADVRELLELAARAAGVPWRDGAPSRLGFAGWNPGTDDGDSRRLQVACNIDLSPNATGESIAFAYTPDGVGYMEPHGEDTAAACRMAVLRAAAAIGRTMLKVQA